jgi:acid phosphatase
MGCAEFDDFAETDMNMIFRILPVLVMLGTALDANAATMSGVVVGNDGNYANAKVCLDANLNGRCDKAELNTVTNAQGVFSLHGKGAVVAEIDGINPLVFRAPAKANAVVDAISTELQAMMDANGGKFAAARASLAKRVGVLPSQIVEDFSVESDPAVKAALQTENQQLLNRIAEAVKEAGTTGKLVKSLRNRLALDQITNVVFIYAENRSFDNFYGLYPGANGIKDALKNSVPQKDRDGSTLAFLPPVFAGVTAAGQPVTVTQAQTTDILPNAPFQIDAATPPWGSPATPQTVTTRDLYHRFFENQMQINGGANDMFAAWADSGGLVMGYYDGGKMELWDVAKQYTLADNFFMGTFGGSFLNHQYLVCACAPEYPHADTAAAHPTVAVVDTDTAGHFFPMLTRTPASPASAKNGPPIFVLSGNVAPYNYFGDNTFRAINTMQSAYQPSGNVADAMLGPLYANAAAATTLPVQKQTSIGNLLNAKGVNWVWYAGGWNDAMADRTKVYNASFGNFQAHHQPFNYFADFDPATHAPERATHLKDYSDFVTAVAAGKLPPVAFYKPIGSLNQHPGYANVTNGDAHIAEIINKLKASPQWRHMLVVITYDENGGFWDHVAPPKGDLLGPATRIPALIVSPFARKGMVDHTQYDTASILRFLTHRYSLPVLDGLQVRDAAVTVSTGKPMGDFTNALSF